MLVKKSYKIKFRNCLLLAVIGSSVTSCSTYDAANSNVLHSQQTANNILKQRKENFKSNPIPEVRSIRRSTVHISDQNIGMTPDTDRKFSIYDHAKVFF
jgi:phage terminase small subunit